MMSSERHSHSSVPLETDYIRTTTQNYVSRSAQILGSSNVIIRGKTIVKPNVTIHGDFGAPVQIGRYCRIDEGAFLSPTIIPISSDPLLATSDAALGSSSSLSSSSLSSSPPSNNEKALHLLVGSHTLIGPNSRVQSLSVGSFVRIGANCKLCPRSKVYDCCIIEDDTCIPPDMIVPPFSRVRGNPGRIVGNLPECCGTEFLERCVSEYAVFVRNLERNTAA